MNVLDFILQFTDIIIWPATLLIILGWFRTELKSFFGKLKKIEASTDGIVFESFEQKMEKAKSLFSKIPVSKSSTSIPTSTKYTRNAELDNNQQLNKWKELLTQEILTKAGGGQIPIEQALKKLKKSGKIDFKKYQAIHSLLEITRNAPKEISDSQMSQIESYFKKLDKS